MAVNDQIDGTGLVLLTKVVSSRVSEIALQLGEDNKIIHLEDVFPKHVGSLVPQKYILDLACLLVEDLNNPVEVPVHLIVIEFNAIELTFYCWVLINKVFQEVRYRATYFEAPMNQHR